MLEVYPPPSPTLGHPWVCPMRPPKSKLQQPGAPVKSGGQECLPQALPGGQTPGKNSWDYLLLSEMDLEPHWLKSEVAFGGAARPGLWQAQGTVTHQNVGTCCLPVWICFLFLLLTVILTNHLLPEALLTPSFAINPPPFTILQQVEVSLFPCVLTCLVL